MYFLSLSNQSKEAFIDWARYDDSQDHFCELDGKVFKLLQCLLYLLSFKKKTVATLQVTVLSLSFVRHWHVTVHIILHAKKAV